MEELPDWEPGTPAVLCVRGPHAIPVSTAVRVDGYRILLGLGRRREALERLRSDPVAAFCLLGPGLAFTAHGEARVLAEELGCSGTVVAVELRVERVQDHLADGRTEMLDAPRWRWRDESLSEADDALRAELMQLGREAPGG